MEWPVPNPTPLSPLGSIIKSYLTGPDGESYAPGRLMAFAAFAIAQVTFLGVGLRLLLAKTTLISDWALFFQFGLVWQGGMAGVAVGLILGQAPTDAGGKWWSGKASPPPSPTGGDNTKAGE